jgi:hypothetical protein
LGKRCPQGLKAHDDYIAFAPGINPRLGTTFSRAEKEGKRIGLSAPAMAILHEMHCASIYGSEPMVQNPVKAGLVRLLGREKAQGLNRVRKKVE